jgi:predicted ATP-dependent serine protease
MSGSAVLLNRTRPVLVEIQALVAQSSLGHPVARLLADAGRLAMVLVAP